MDAHPALERRPAVGLNPTTPQSAAGMRTDPGERRDGESVSIDDGELCPGGRAPRRRGEERSYLTASVGAEGDGAEAGADGGGGAAG